MCLELKEVSLPNIFFFIVRLYFQMPVKVSASSWWQAYSHDSTLYWNPYESNISAGLKHGDQLKIKIFPAISNNPTHIFLTAIKKEMQWKNVFNNWCQTDSKIVVQCLKIVLKGGGEISPAFSFHYDDYSRNNSAQFWNRYFKDCGWKKVLSLSGRAYPFNSECSIWEHSMLLWVRLSDPGNPDHQQE